MERIVPDRVGGAFVTGCIESGNDSTAHALHLNADGSLASNGGGCSHRSAAGRILVAGCFPRIGGQDRPGLARLLSDGSVDLAFQPAIAATAPLAVPAMSAYDDGRILLAGAFSAMNDSFAGNVARLLGNPVLLRQSVDSRAVSIEIATIAGRTYTLEWSESLPTLSWLEAGRVTGDGQVKTLQSGKIMGTGFYRIRIQ